jgi:hypothetical protein
MKARIALFPRSAATLVLPLALLFTNPASGQTEQPQVELPLINPVTSTLTGTYIPATTMQTDPNDPSTVIAVPSACQFAITLGPGKAAIEARQTSAVSIDDTNQTCSAQFQMGEPQTETTPSPAELANQANSASSSSNTPSASDGSTSTDDPDTSAASTVSAGFMHTWWIDSNNVVQNSVQDSTKWRWSGAGHCVTGLSGGRALVWLVSAGWLLSSDTFQNTYNCTETTVASNVVFVNSLICPRTTFADYLPNEVRGTQNGTLRGVWNDHIVNSTCSHLRLRAHLQRTQN